MMRRRRKNKKFKILIIMLIFIISISVSFAYLSSNLTIRGNVKGLSQNTEIIIEPGSNPDFQFGTPTVNKWVEANLYKYQYEANLINNSTNTYDNYKITISFNSNIESVEIWNNEYKIEQNKLIVTNNNYVLKPKKSVKIGFIITSLSANLKINSIKIEILTDYNEIDPSLFDVEFVKTGGWGNYTYQYDVFITNKTGSVVNSWNIEVTLPNKTSYISGWNAVFTFKSQILTIKNTSYNAKIENNEKIQFGLQLSTNIVNYIPTDFKVTVR